MSDESVESSKPAVQEVKSIIDQLEPDAVNLLKVLEKFAGEIQLVVSDDGALDINSLGNVLVKQQKWILKHHTQLLLLQVVLEQFAALFLTPEQKESVRAESAEILKRMAYTFNKSGEKSQQAAKSRPPNIQKASVEDLRKIGG